MTDADAAAAGDADQLHRQSEHVTAYHAIVDVARHFNFTSLGAIAAEIPALEHERWLVSGETARQIHDEAAKRVRQFLDAHLKGNEAAGRSLCSNEGFARIRFHRIVTLTSRKC